MEGKKSEILGEGTPVGITLTIVLLNISARFSILFE
jgi:hypothetical protein